MREERIASNPPAAHGSSSGPLELPSSQPEPEPEEPELRPMGTHIFPRDTLWPLVQFENGNRLLCCAINFESQGYLGNVEARRTQVPLILAWALSIHKSQGQTLSRVKVDLGHTFEKGQGEAAYMPLRASNSLTLDTFSLRCSFESDIDGRPRDPEFPGFEVSISRSKFLSITG